jgi:phosphotransferase system  glucose/maltose/N-acetylglucosamine-specific IIC component
MVWKAATVMLVYAVAMIVVGLVTFLLAPPGAKAITALLVPGGIGVLTGVCGVISLRIETNRALGMLGIHLGLVLPLLAAIGAGVMVGRGMAAARDTSQDFRAINRALRDSGRALITATETGSITPQTLEASGAVLSVPRSEGLRPSGYKIAGQAGVVAVSAVAFVSLLLHRPSPAPKPAAPPPAPPKRTRPDDGE